MELAQVSAQISVLDVVVLVLKVAQDALAAQDVLEHVLISVEVAVIQVALQVVVVLVLRAVQLDAPHVQQHVMDAQELAQDALLLAKDAQDARIIVALDAKISAVELVLLNVVTAVNRVATLDALRAVRNSA